MNRELNSMNRGPRAVGRLVVRPLVELEAHRKKRHAVIDVISNFTVLGLTGDLRGQVKLSKPVGTGDGNLSVATKSTKTTKSLLKKATKVRS